MSEPLQVLWEDESLGGGGLAPHGEWVVADDDTVFAVAGIVGEDPTVIAAHDLDTGERLWTTRIESGWPSLPQFVADGIVLVTPQYEDVFALDVTTGRVVWRAAFDEGYGVATAAAAGDSVILVADSYYEGDERPPIVRRVSLRDGSTAWETQLRDGRSVQWSPPLIADGRLLVATVPGGDQQYAAVHALALADGMVGWTRDVGPSQANGRFSAARMHAGPGVVHAPVPSASIPPAENDLPPVPRCDRRAIPRASTATAAHGCWRLRSVP